MPTHLRFRLLIGAIVLIGLLMFLPSMKQLRAIGACLDSGNVWDYSTRVCVAPVNPHPTAADTVTPKVKPRIVPAH